MNLAIRGIFADIRWNPEGTLLKNAFPDERFDFILANPPFNISDWNGDLLREDQRWTFGTPPVGSANFAWMAHIHHQLSANGIGGVVMSNGSMTSTQSGEGEIRKSMVLSNAVDAIVALPGQLFFGTPIAACLWILAKDRSNGTANGSKLRDRRNEVLFIDASSMGTLVSGSRKQKELSDDEIERVANTYHSWRGEKQVGPYGDIPGFCVSANVEEIRKNDFIMTPGRYVGAHKKTNDSRISKENLNSLFENLSQQMAESRRIDEEIVRKLGWSQ
ncbi:N-6 DNA Methylase [Loktanella salsilacus]|uniref:N-6 DNA Methylase n=2 Tax=Loktanella salsilacus TaxID=195913 RepID=A0A1I4HB07_9RHOB|nr:N-6 DNA Methylase [Loktanella salsilacus]